MFSEKMDDEVFLENRWQGLHKPLEGNIYLVCKRYRMVKLYLLSTTFYKKKNPLTE